MSENNPPASSPQTGHPQDPPDALAPSTAERTLLPSPFPKEDGSPDVQTGDDAGVPQQADSAFSPQSSELSQPFSPFFTLVEDVTSSSLTGAPAAPQHHHPTVHYIFSDDAPDLITEASLRALGVDPEDATGRGYNDGSRTRTIEDAEEEEEDPPMSALPPPRPGVRERYILLDISPSAPETKITPAETGNASTGQSNTASLTPTTKAGQAPAAGTGVQMFHVTAAHSLSPSWQITNADISQAPTWDAGGAAVGGGWMLRIEGTEGAVGPDDVSAKETADMMELMKRFEKRMVELKRVVDSDQGK